MHVTLGAHDWFFTFLSNVFGDNCENKLFRGDREGWLVGNRKERMNRMFSFAWTISMYSQSAPSGLLTSELLLVLQNSAQLLLPGTDTASCSQKFTFSSSSCSTELFYVSQPPVLPCVLHLVMEHKHSDITIPGHDLKKTSWIGVSMFFPFLPTDKEKRMKIWGDLHWRWQNLCQSGFLKYSMVETWFTDP